MITVHHDLDLVRELAEPLVEVLGVRFPTKRGKVAGVNELSHASRGGVQGRARANDESM